MQKPKPQLVAVLALLAALAAGTTAGAVREAGSVSVSFLRGEQLASVARPGSTPTGAVRALLRGPTDREVKRGFRTYVPAGTALHSVTIANGVATVDLGARFTAGDRGSLLARLSQLVRTLTVPPQVKSVQLLIDGAKVSGVFPGVPTADPITFAFLATPNRPVPKPPERKRGPVDAHVKSLQSRLIALSYLPPGSADGRLGPATQNAVLAFQKWERLPRTGAVDAATEARLARASRPIPVTMGARGKRAEVLLQRQVALLIVGNRVVRTIAVSTGKPATPTPPGAYRVCATIERWWSVPFREWLPWAVPFVGGIAFHEFPVVPAFAASHGCVRQSVAVAHGTFAFAEIGMPVRVIRA
jgi:peptidoglycan hydrolase-like protein with peptidoglycan-binding domain